MWELNNVENGSNRDAQNSMIPEEWKNLKIRYVFFFL